MNLKIPTIFKPLFKYEYKDLRLIIYYGGRGGGKSLNISDFLLLECLKSNIKVYIVREIEKTKSNSTLSLIKRRIEDLELKDYISLITNDKILFINGAEIIFNGLSKRTVDNIRGLDNIKYFWFDEAHNIDEAIIRTLIPSIRGEESQIIISFNPNKEGDYIYREYVKKDNEGYSKAIKVNYSDNPFFPSILEKDRLRDKELLPLKSYLHIWEGETLNYNDMQIINMEKVGFYNDNEAFGYDILIFSIDTAFSVSKSADYSAIGVFGKKGDFIHVIHMARGKWEFFNLLETIKGLYHAIIDRVKQAPQLILIENKASGYSIIQELKRTTNLPVKEVKPIVDKLNRVINNIIPHLYKLKLPLNKLDSFNSWVDSYILEMEEFRGDNKHMHDDMVDVTSQALEYLNNQVINYDIMNRVFS